MEWWSRMPPVGAKLQRVVGYDASTASADGCNSFALTVCVCVCVRAPGNCAAPVADVAQLLALLREELGAGPGTQLTASRRKAYSPALAAEDAKLRGGGDKPSSSQGIAAP
eukprot:SAG22_NODE_8486_length_652_cov_1.016275_1_plen_110_part_10